MCLKMLNFHHSRGAIIAVLALLLALPSGAINVKISSFNMFSFPEVHLYVQVADNAGNPIIGLTENDFEVSENGLLPDWDVIPAYYGGISYGLALDCSGSMYGYENQVKTACTTFVAYMDPLDQASVIFFEFYGNTRVVQPMTNNHALLNTAILGYYTNGSTALWYGYTQALWEVQDEIPPRVMIGFTDGDDNNSGSYTQSTVTNLALAAGAPVNSIGIGGVYAAPLIAVANATRGQYVQTIPDSLWWYYQHFQEAYANQYEAAYISPDPNPNGSPRHISVAATYQGQSDSDTISFNAPFVPDFAPIITLTPNTQDTLLVQPQQANSTVTVTAWITDNDILTSTLIRHRHIGTTNFNYGVMSRLNDSLYAFTFQTAYVTSPGIEFYLLACDSYNHSISSPAAFPSVYPHQLAVLPNNKPEIIHTPINEWPAGLALPINCTIQDATASVAYAKLFFKNNSEIFWTDVPMTNLGGNAWTGLIPAAVMLANDDLQYYIRAWDNQGTYNTNGPHPINVGVAPLNVTMTPINPPIEIHPGGGTFSFNALLQNLAAAPLPFDAWIMVTLPNGAQFGPALGPLLLTLPANGSLARVRTQTVPAGAPPGSYIYTLNGGDYPSVVWDSDSFPFTKLGSGIRGHEFGDWANIGEDFVGGTSSVASSSRSDMTPTMEVSPNPFNPTTAISYQLSAFSRVSLKVYDTAGRLVETLVDGWREAGVHEVRFDGSDLPSGVYIYRLTAGEFSAGGKMVLMK